MLTTTVFYTSHISQRGHLSTGGSPRVDNIHANMPVDVLLSPGDHLCSEFCLLFGDGGAERLTLADPVRLHRPENQTRQQFVRVPTLFNG